MMRLFSVAAALIACTRSVRIPSRGKAVAQVQASITISGRQLLVDGAPFHIKGVCWNPVAKGGSHPANTDYSGFAERDSELMKEAGINVVRVYDPIFDRRVLDTFLRKGIRIAMGVYPWAGAPASRAKEVVEQLRDHPAILLWEVGNEWNYNGLYYGLSFEAARDRVGEVARLVKQADTSRPVVSVYGEIPSTETINILSQVDMWGINAYRGIGFGSLFNQFAAVSNKPMYMGEYGADAWNNNTNSNDNAAQADATRVLTQTIIDNSAVNGGVCSGGAIFEFADEWWKDSNGSPWNHDIGGIAPGGGPHPDATFNEEWWGLLDIDRQPRPAYHEYKRLAVPGNGAPVPSPPATNPVPTPSGSCDAQWNNLACASSGDCYTCGDRITWVMDNLWKSEQEAKNQIAAEFPQECGDCRSSGPAPTSSPAPTPPGPGTCSAADLTCGVQWPETIYDCGARSLTGTELRTDYAVKACKDCAFRCWLMWRDCAGFVTDQAGDHAGTCTYYSSITGASSGGAATGRAFVTAASLSRIG